MQATLAWAMTAAAAWTGVDQAQTSPVQVGPAGRPTPEVVSYPSPGAAVNCAEGAARVVSADAPPPSVDVRRSPLIMIPPVPDRSSSLQVGPPSHLFTFNVTADGRTGAIRRSSEPANAYDRADHPIQAAIAAWRFAPGRAQTGCRYLAEPRRTPLPDADRATLLQVMSETRPGEAGALLRKAVLAPGSDCMRDRPDPRLLAFPPFDDIAAPPGKRDWVALGHDLDPTGRPEAVQVLASTGNAALNAAGVQAKQQSRYEPGARRGCLDWYSRTPTELPAPPRPDISTLIRPGDNCPNTEGRKDRVKLINGALIYPPEFRARNILGWAIVRFDVASWGAVGPAEVVAAEPAAAFGQAAQSLMVSARADPGPGWRGCLQPVVFQISDEGELLEFERELRVR